MMVIRHRLGEVPDRGAENFRPLGTVFVRPRHHRSGFRRFCIRINLLLSFLALLGPQHLHLRAAGEPMGPVCSGQHAGYQRMAQTV